MKKPAIDFLFVLNAAVTNVRLYPPSSGIIQRSIERMGKALEDALAVWPSIEFAESEKNLLVNGEPLAEKEQQRPQIRSFISLMLDLNVKSMAFSPGITIEEITSFLEMLGKTPEEIRSAGGPARVLAEKNISRISIDEKIYVQMDSEHQIIAGLDISDEDFARYLLGEESVDAETIAQLRQMAADPAWFADVFEAGVRYLMEQRPDASRAEQARWFDRILDFLGHVSGRDRQALLGSIMEALPKMNEKVQILVRDEAAAQRPEPVHEPDKPDRPGTGNAEPAEPASRAEHVKDALSRILKGDTRPFSDPQTVAVLPKVAFQLMDRKKDDTLAALTEQMGKALLHESAEVRKAVAGILARLDEYMVAENQLDQRMALSKKLVEWIKAEETISAEYRRVTERLENLAETILSQGNRPGEADHILEAYALIRDGSLSKEEAIQTLAANMLQHLSTDHILEMLLNDPKKSAHSGKDDIYSLVILGSGTLERLLDRLHDTHSMSERNRIVQAVTGMGRIAVPAVVQRLDQGGPWYYIRNLALLLGRIGGPEDLASLEPLLTYPDYRVQLEAVKSIQAINGETAGALLLKYIPVVDPQLVDHIVSVLGALKYQPAVPYLITILESRSIWENKAVREEIRAKACEALGRIQAAEAVPVLEKIVRTRGFFRGYPENVRSAAAKAAAHIKRG